MSTTESQVRRYNNYLDGLLGSCGLYDFADKEKAIDVHIRYMLNRTQSMFKWEGLPDTIPERMLELMLQTNGNVFFYKYDGNLYVFTGGLGGEPDEYYRPTLYTIANPALKLSKSLRIDVDGILMPNDSMFIGLIPMFKKYSSAMIETELSLNISVINSRIFNIISAPDDRSYESAKQYLDDVKDGKLGVISENVFTEGIRAQPYGTTSNASILNLIEYEQYLRASWYNELGLNANFNMKREKVSIPETQLNEDALLPFTDNMLLCRQKAVEKVNEMFETNISVDYASSWEDNIEEIEAEIDNLVNGENPETERGEVIQNEETENTGE